MRRYCTSLEMAQFGITTDMVHRKVFQTRSPGTAVMAEVTAVSRRKESMSLFWVTSCDTINDVNWEEGTGSYYWQAVS